MGSTFDASTLHDHSALTDINIIINDAAVDAAVRFNCYILADVD